MTYVDPLVERLADVFERGAYECADYLAHSGERARYISCERAAAYADDIRAIILAEERAKPAAQRWAEMTPAERFEMVATHPMIIGPSREYGTRPESMSIGRDAVGGAIRETSVRPVRGRWQWSIAIDGQEYDEGYGLTYDTRDEALAKLNERLRVYAREYEIVGGIPDAAPVVDDNADLDLSKDPE